MKGRIAIGPGILVSMLLFGSCADTSDFLTERTHPDGWLDPSSPDFHGKLVLESARETDSCQTCHGEDFSGGTAKVACSSCHATYPHPDGWLEAASTIFHGKFVLESATKAETCGSCHGEDFGGGSVDVACASCHPAYPHPDGFAVPSDPRFHEASFQQDLNWDLTICQSCHGDAYDGRGGISPDAVPDNPKNCLQCHTANDGPENCTTCHGGTSGNVAPPQALLDGESTNVPGVGAHQQHLLSQIAAIGLECSHCHELPAEYKSPGHVLEDDTPGRAELVFGPLATHGGELDVQYNFSTQTCSNSYCHGNFEFSRAESNFPFAYAEDVITGENVQVIWNQVGAGHADCGTCHGLPPAGHIASSPTQCANCHGDVVNAVPEIIAPELHMNGQIEVF